MYGYHDAEINNTDHWATVGDLTDMLFPVPDVTQKDPFKEIKHILFEEVDMAARIASYNSETKTYSQAIYNQEKKANEEKKAVANDEYWLKTMFSDSDNEDCDTKDDNVSITVIEEKSNDVIPCSVCNKYFHIKETILKANVFGIFETKCCSPECAGVNLN